MGRMTDWKVHLPFCFELEVSSPPFDGHLQTPFISGQHVVTGGFDLIQMVDVLRWILVPMVQSILICTGIFF